METTPEDFQPRKFIVQANNEEGLKAILELVGNSPDISMYETPWYEELAKKESLLP